ncbi:uncharacterized protein LOC123896193 [Trifolium pratense]|uniref:uncharacterized protein LOC123896193 n=1 Tax=Trifolium pratense TaxID=57577 RepID=UPI001E695E00|nr:uncharacterized protein LOC123896193 [Trifolium pratense]
MVIADSKGDRVQAITRHKEFEHWKDFVVYNNVYVLHNCHVYDNDAGFKTCDSPYKVVFGSGTKFMKDDSITNIPSHHFRFKSFKEVQDGKFKINLLYEIIGVLHEVVKTQTATSGRKPCTNLILANESGDMVDVTLWEAFSTQLQNFISGRKEKGPIFLILTHAQCKLGDNGRPTFCNNWSGSQLLINHNHPDVANFKSLFKDIENSQAATQDFTQVSSSSQLGKDDHFSNMSQVKTIAQMKLSQKDSYCITVGTTKKFNPNQFGWYYESCSKCTKSSRSMGENYTCSCGENVKVPIARYKVVIQVESEGHKADFVFWDSECHSIIGTTAEELREKMKKVGEDDPKIYPIDLDKLLNLEFAYKVKYQSYYRQASINQMTNDPTLIANIKLHMNLKHPSQSVEIELKDGTNAQKENTECSDSLVFASQSLSACGDNEFDITSNSTPAKRLSAAIQVDDIPSPPLTTTKRSSTKNAKHVKLE